jgi:hypothetical protein
VVKGGLRVSLTNIPPSVSGLFRKCGSLDLSQNYRPPRPVTGIPFSFVSCFVYVGNKTKTFALTYLKQSFKLDELIMNRKNVERKLLILYSHLNCYVNNNRMNLTYIMGG